MKVAEIIVEKPRLYMSSDTLYVNNGREKGRRD